MKNMKITDTKEIIEELNYLTRDLDTGEMLSLDSLDVKSSNFYKIMQTLEVLDASFVTYSDLTQTGMLLLAQIAGASPTLREINISENKLGENGVKVAAELAKSTSLESIDMKSNKLGEHGVMVATELAKSTSLESIDMKSNRLGEHGAIVAAELAKLKTLTSVDMSWNGLGKHGAIVAAELAKSTSLESINMSWNYLGEHGAIVATELAKLKTLTSINMSWNGLGENGVKVATELAKSKSLTKLKMDLFIMEKQDAENITKVIDDHNTPKYISAIIDEIGDFASYEIASKRVSIGDVIKQVAEDSGEGVIGDYYDNIIVLE